VEKTKQSQMEGPRLGAQHHKEPDQDLICLRDKALELGASAAEVIPASYVLVQERVWMKCLVPRCPRAGQSPYCPPNSPKPDFMRKVFSQYQKALVFKRDIWPIEDYIASSVSRHTEIESHYKGKYSFHRKTWEIVGRLESYAQSRGYYLSMGFSAGDCKNSLCANLPCAVMQNEDCRHPLWARPSMEAVGIDVFDLAKKLGWEIYMIRRVEPDLSAIPCAISVGIVFLY
jgi:predicted metal-binding protein